MNEKEILEHLTASALEDKQYFSNANKQARELWVASTFVSALGIKHEQSELKPLDQNNDVDVEFRDACFQIKEIVDPNLRRQKMYNDVYDSFRTAKSLSEVSLVSQVSDISPIVSVYQLVADLSEKLANGKYKGSSGEIDLLIYATRTRASLIQQHELNEPEFSGSGWRSISCLNSKQAVVLFASPSAPFFIREHQQKIVTVSS